MQDLAEKLESYLEQANGIEQTNHFVIDDDRKADWAIRKIVKLQRRNEEIDNLANDQIEKIENWRKQTKAENQAVIDRLKNLLRPYAESQLTGKKKTIKLPAGDVSFRATPPKFFIGGEEVKGENAVLTAYVEQHAPEFLKVKKSADWANFKRTLKLTGNGQVVTQDGEVLGFIQAVEYPDSMVIKERE